MEKTIDIRKQVAITVNQLCDWIQEHCEKGTSGEELKVLPEVIKATAELFKVMQL